MLVADTDHQQPGHFSEDCSWLTFEYLIFQLNAEFWVTVNV